MIARLIDDVIDIESKDEDRIRFHNEDIQFEYSILDETYNHRTGAERTNDAVKDYNLGHMYAEAASTHEQVFFVLCLRLVVTIIPYERGDDSGREKFKLGDGLYDIPSFS